MIRSIAILSALFATLLSRLLGRRRGPAAPPTNPPDWIDFNSRPEVVLLSVAASEKNCES